MRDLFASPTIGLLTPQVGVLPVAPQATGGQGLALDPTGQLPSAVRQVTRGYELSYTEFTGNVSITATTEATANTIVTAPALIFDGQTPIIIKFSAFEAVTAAAGTQLNFWLYDGANSIGGLAALFASAGTVAAQVEREREFTPTVGPHTYSIRASNSAAGTATVFSGAGGVGNNLPGFLRITRG